MLKRAYGATVFLSAAMLMVLEITAGRIIAPYVGNSLYSWTSVIGIVLAGLSFGNWLGGWLADRNHGHLTLGVTLGLGALASLLVLALLPAFGTLLQGRTLSLAWTSILLVLGLFLLPSILLGVISPLATTLYLKIDNSIGRAVGLLHALAATGSIFGTFAAGFLFIQWIGTRWTVILVAAVLLLLAVPWLLRGRHRTAVLTSLLGAVAAITAIAGRVDGFASPCDEESRYYCLRVVEETDGNGEAWARSLVIDHMRHGTNVLDDTQALWTPYIHGMDTLVEARFPVGKPLQYFFVGGGTYTHPRALADRTPRPKIVVSEIDPAVTRISESMLDLDTSVMTIHHTDSRYALSLYGRGHFDVIVLDAFHDVGIPHHLVTREFNDNVRQRLADNGLYLINAIDRFPDSALIRSMLTTLEESFKHVGVWIERPGDDQDRLTYIVCASRTPLPFALIASARGLPRTWYDITEFVKKQREQYGAVVLTDDYAPVERLISVLFTSPEQI